MSIYVKMGSRYEPQSASGTAALLFQHLLRKEGLQNGLKKLGAAVKVHMDREIMGLTLGVLNEDAQEAAELLLNSFSRDVKWGFECGFGLRIYFLLVDLIE